MNHLGAAKLTLYPPTNRFPASQRQQTATGREEPASVAVALPLVAFTVSRRAKTAFLVPKRGFPAQKLRTPHFHPDSADWMASASANAIGVYGSVQSCSVTIWLL